MPYQISAAQEFFPLKEEEIKAKGFNWYPASRQSYAVTLPSRGLPDKIEDAKDNILGEVIGCAHEEKCQEECTGAFRIIDIELEFCRRMNLPLPRLCPNCRHAGRIALRNPPKFYKRKCDCLPIKTLEKMDAYKNFATHFHGENPCPTEFETSYAPDRPEIVYCEQCYNSEVV